MELNYNKIIEIQHNRPPYLMMDYATNVVPGKLSEGYKDLKSDEWFFKVHWKDDPNMPGMLQVEALVQIGSLAILTLPNLSKKILYLTSADKLKFYKKIIIGDRLEIKTELLEWKRGMGKFIGSGYVNNKIACKANFTLILPEMIKQFNK